MTKPQLIDVVKRSGERKSEQFNRDKLHASIIAACLSVRSPHGMAHSTADSVCTVVVKWSTAKPKITSSDIRRVAADHLERIHPEAAYLYKHHRLVL